MKSLPYIVWLLFWVVSPIFLLFSIVFRYNAFSAFYCLLLVTFPYSPRLKSYYLHSWLRYTRTVLLLSSAFLLAQIGFQLALAIKPQIVPDIGSDGKCSQTELTLSYIGLHRFGGMPALDVFRLLAPEVFVFTISIVTYALTAKIRAQLEASEGENDESLLANEPMVLKRKVAYQRLKNGGLLCFTVAFLALSGICYPNLVSSVYLLSFFLISFLWGFNQPILTPAITVFRAVLSGISALQLLFFYIYQIGYFRSEDGEAGNNATQPLFTRLVGLRPIVTQPCSATQRFPLIRNKGVTWVVYVSLMLTFVLHWSMAVGVRMFFRDYLVFLTKFGYSLKTAPSVITNFIKKKQQPDERPLIREDSVSSLQQERHHNEQRKYGSMDQQEQEQNSQSSNDKEDKRVLVEIYQWIDEIKNFSFYILTLVAMVFWSVTYQSWPTFLLLVLSLVLWWSKNSRNWTLKLSPFITVYGILLILLEYIYALPLTESELPTTVNLTNSNRTLALSQFGIKRYTVAFPSLGLKLVYLLAFLVTMNQRKHVMNKIPANGRLSNMAVFVERVYKLLCKYWVFVVTAFHFAMVTEGRPSGIKIVYMALLAVYLVTFVTSWKLWRKTLTSYFVLLEIYTIVVLVVIYTYQFQGFPQYWKSFTNFTDEQLEDLGLVQQSDTWELIKLMLLPTLFLLCVMVQLHYVNQPFLQGVADPATTTTSRRESSPSQSRDSTTIAMNDIAGADGKNADVIENHDHQHQDSGAGKWLKKGWRNVKELVCLMMTYLMRLLNFHVGKLVYITVMYAADVKPSAVFAIIVVMWIVCLPFKRLHSFLYDLTTVFVSLVLIGSMFVQLHLVQVPTHLTVRCSLRAYNQTQSKNLSTLEWIGFEKMETTNAFFYHAQGLISILIMIAFERVVRRRHRYVTRRCPEEGHVTTSVFPQVTWRQADKGVREWLMYYANFFFYNFGLEICYVVTLLTILETQDFFAVVYSLLFLVSFLITKRTALRKYFRFQVAVLMVVYIWIYLCSIGMPPQFCVDNQYPWTQLGSSLYEQKRLITWLYLPDFFTKGRQMSIFEFLQILVHVAQLAVFELETAAAQSSAEREFGGGDNARVSAEMLDRITVASNPTENFMITANKTPLHKIKVFVYEYFVWFTMAAIFLSGSAQISLFCLGYLVGFFYLLVKQQLLMCGPVKILAARWRSMLAYNIVVIVVKTMTQLGACVYRDRFGGKGCVFVELLSLICSFSQRYLYDPATAGDKSCVLTQLDSGMGWDIACFVFLIIQTRIYATFEFLHVREDVVSSFALASRGAEMYKDILVDEARERESEESKVIREIKQSMQRMKEKYAKLHGQISPDMDHYDAVRSGNELMFEELDDKSQDDDVINDAAGGDVRTREASSNSDDATSPSGGYNSSNGGGKLRRYRSFTSNKNADLLTGKRTSSSMSQQQQIEDEDEEGLQQICAEEGDDEVMLSDDCTKQEKKTIYERVAGCFKCAWRGVCLVMEWSADKINSWNYKYRNIHAKLAAEKAILSKKLASGGGGLTSNHSFVKRHNFLQSRSTSSLPLPKSTHQSVLVEYEGMRKVRSENTVNKGVPLYDLHKFDKLKHPAVQLTNALWYSFITRTELVCYLLILLNLTLTASILSLVLPLAIFFWATFTIPRPSKTFWTCVMVYLELVICVRFLFQFDFFKWNSTEEETILVRQNPYWYPTFIGINKSDSWMVLDLLQLLFVVFHVNVIKTLGLWNEQSAADNAVDDFLRLREVRTQQQQLQQHQQASTSDTAPTSPLRHVTSATSHDNLKAQIESDEQLSYFYKIILKIKLRSDLAEREGVTSSLSDRIVRGVMSPVIFYWEALNQRFTLVSDVYIYMLLCDVINSFILMFGYWAFGPYANVQSNVIDQIQDNRVPTGFLIMLMLQFAMIFVDRALYLRKNLGGKMCFHIFLVVFIHVWLFFILPGINGSPFFNNHVAQSWYFFKAIYFLLSAYQIRHGYPTIVNINFLTKSHGTLNLILFKTFRAIPFLAELTAIMNWMFTETTLVISEWMTLWSIEGMIFELKCWRVLEKKYKGVRGVVQAHWYKYLVGGSIVFFVILIIWFPLLLMNLVLTIAGVPNNPSSFDVKLVIDTFEPLISVSTDNSTIQTLSNKEYIDLKMKFQHNQKAQAFLADFSHSQVTEVTMNSDSKNLWQISPPQEERLLDKLINNQTLTISFEWTIARNADLTGVYIATGRLTNELSHNQTIRRALIDMLQAKPAANHTTYVTVPNLLPVYLHSQATSSSAVIPRDLVTSSNLTFGLKKSGAASWWQIKSDRLRLTVFSDKVSPASLNFLVSYGIIGLYVSVVLVVGRLFRTLYLGLAESIMFKELPNVDRINQLCGDILLVRELGEFELEEDLYAKLIYLYRSPATMIGWTKKND